MDISRYFHLVEGKQGVMQTSLETKSEYSCVTVVLNKSGSRVEFWVAFSAKQCERDGIFQR